MTEDTKNELVKKAWELHSLIEKDYLQHPATNRETDDRNNWLEKQRLLLADMAIHLLQTAIKPGNIELASLRNNVHAILTISDQFLPLAELKKATDKLYVDQ